MSTSSSGRTPEQTIAAIEAMDLTMIKFKATRSVDGDGYGWTPQYADQMEVAYKRYLILHAKYPEMTLAPERDIDRFWHMHILDTRKYATDCDATFGHFLHHFPYLGLRGEGDEQALQDAFEAMQRLYVEEFGEPMVAPKQDAAWCSIEKTQASGQAAWCSIEKAQPGAKAAWCSIEQPAGALKSAWCSIEQPQAKVNTNASPAAKAAWCSIEQPKASAKAAWCSIEQPAPKVQAAWCSIETQPVELQTAAWCSIESPKSAPGTVQAAPQPKAQAAWCSVETAMKAAWCSIESPRSATAALGLDVKVDLH